MMKTVGDVSQQAALGNLPVVSLPDEVSGVTSVEQGLAVLKLTHQ